MENLVSLLGPMTNGQVLGPDGDVCLREWGIV